MRLSLVTPPTVEPVTIAEVKSVSRASISESDDDANFNAWISTAREIVEGTINRQLNTATWRMCLDYWPSESRLQNGNDALPWWVTNAYNQQNAIQFPYPPLIAVTSVNYVDTGGTTTLWPASNYRVSTFGTPGLLTLDYGKYWPPIRPVQDAIVILFTAGYGTSPTSVPQSAKTAIRMLVDELDKNRALSVAGDGGFRMYPNVLSLERILAPLMWGQYN